MVSSKCLNDGEMSYFLNGLDQLRYRYALNSISDAFNGIVSKGGLPIINVPKLKLVILFPI